MRNPNSFNLVLLQGTLGSLYVEAGQEDFLSTGKTHAVAGSTAAGLALAGLAGPATNLLLAAGDRFDSVQRFTATLDGQRIAGRFSKIWFENGNELEVVAEKQGDGTYAAYAVRRASDNTLWMFPHCSRGKKAHWKYAWKMACFLSITIALFLSAIFLVGDFDSDKRFLYFWLMLTAANGVIIGFYLSFKTAYRWKPFVELAEAIFSTLGYKNVAMVDLSKMNKQYWRRFGKTNEDMNAAPWVYRYIDETR